MKLKVMMSSIVIALLALTVGIASAQGDDSSTDRPDRPFALRGIASEVLTVVSEATGLSNQEILQQIRDGSTLAEVVEGTDADLATVIADVTTALTERIEAAVAEERITQDRADEMIANLPDRVDTIFNTVPDFEGRGGGIRDRAGNLTQLIVLDAVMEATDLGLLDITTQLRDGATLADIVTDNGGDVETVIADVVASVTEEINARVDAGTLTQAQADTLLENLEERLTDRFNGELPFQNFDGERGRGNR